MFWMPPIPPIPSMPVIEEATSANGASYSSVNVKNVVNGGGGTSGVEIDTDINGVIHHEFYTQPTGSGGSYHFSTTTGGAHVEAFINTSYGSGGTPTSSRRYGRLHEGGVVAASSTTASTTAHTGFRLSVPFFLGWLFGQPGSTTATGSQTEASSTEGGWLGSLWNWFLRP